VWGEGKHERGRGRGDVPRIPGKSAYDQPGRFEREFVAVDEVGSGEFGRVIKVRKKGGHENEVFAVKKSKTFEGGRHR
jgi:mitosis inhibitor protein kinase SWE1